MDSQAQLEPATGTRQYSSALGKRKPLGERSTNDKPTITAQRVLTNYHFEQKAPSWEISSTSSHTQTPAHCTLTIVNSGVALFYNSFREVGKG